MDEEYQSLIQNNTWSQTKLPTNQNMVCCKRVYKIKFNSNGQVGRFKARLVVKGYSQIEGLDYNDTSSCCKNNIPYSPTSLGDTKKLTIPHMDVKSASYLCVCVCVCVFQLEGYINPNKKDLIYKLHKTIYGLKNKTLVNGTRKLMIT